MSFDAAAHPRATDGTFANKVGSTAEVALTGPSLEASATEHSITFSTTSGDEVQFDHGVRMFAEHIDPLVREREDGNFDVYYASYDDDASDYEFMEGDKLEGFSSAYERDAFIESQLTDGVSPDNIFVVERFDHGSVRYSPLASWSEWTADTRPERQRVSDQWDAAPSHVYVAGESVNPAAQAKGILDDYTMWANGENYIVHRSTVTPEGEALDSDAIHGFVGAESAEEAVRNAEI